MAKSSTCGLALMCHELDLYLPLCLSNCLALPLSLSLSHYLHNVLTATQLQLVWNYTLVTHATRCSLTRCSNSRFWLNNYKVSKCGWQRTQHLDSRQEAKRKGKLQLQLHSFAAFRFANCITIRQLPVEKLFKWVAAAAAEFGRVGVAQCGAVWLGS